MVVLLLGGLLLSEFVEGVGPGDFSEVGGEGVVEGEVHDSKEGFMVVFFGAEDAQVGVLDVVEDVWGSFVKTKITLIFLNFLLRSFHFLKSNPFHSSFRNYN